MNQEMVPQSIKARLKLRKQFIGLLFFTSLVLLLPFSSLSQAEQIESAPKFVIHADLGSNFLVGSSTLNVEYHLSSFLDEHFNLYARLGVGTGQEAFLYQRVGIMAGGSLLYGKGMHHIELSGGPALTSKLSRYRPDYGYAIVVDFGYRYQKRGNGFIFRVKAGLLGIGIGIGYAF